jgi:subtilisin family serine protease
LPTGIDQRLPEQAIDRITAESGTLFVVAAGNSGPGNGTVSSLGAAESALTVGAVDRDDALADFSSRGPRPAQSRADRQQAYANPTSLAKFVSLKAGATDTRVDHTIIRAYALK